MNKPVIPPTPSREEYENSGDYKDDIFEQNDPFKLFASWMSDARSAEVNDANAMSLSTVDAAGMPDVRVVLLKGFDERGFTFYSHEDSAKGQQLNASGKAALCFHWKSLRRQIRIRGTVSAVKGAEADEYFASRARGSQLGAWSSDQSRSLASRDVMQAKIKATEARFDGGIIPRPDFWYGWRVKPLQIEFWRDRPYRLHDRLSFTREDQNKPWTKGRLYP